MAASHDLSTGLRRLEVVLEKNHRILVVDDNPSIHDDYRKILGDDPAGDDFEAEAAEVFGGAAWTVPRAPFEMDFALQGKEALELVRAAVKSGRRYALVFTDMRMPPGWNGLETTKQLWEADPDLQVVICTAYSDYSWTEMMRVVGSPERLLILKKPFDTIEVLQFAHALTEKWSFLQAARLNTADLQRVIDERTQELRTANGLLASEIEEHKRASEALRSTHDQLQRMLDHSPVVLYSLQIDDGQIVPRVVSENIHALLGFSAAEAVSHKWWFDQLHMEDRERAVDGFRETLERGSFQSEYRLHHKDGSVRWVKDIRRAVRDSDGKPSKFVGVWIDVTGRKTAEEALLLPARVLESMVEGVVVSDADGMILLSNPASDAMFDHPRETLAGENISVLSDLPAAETGQFASRISEELDRTNRWSGEISSRGKNGSTVVTLARITSLKFGGKQCAVALHEDITQKKQLELHALRAQRIESVGRLAGGIAHDMNNVLGPIMMSSMLLREAAPGEETEQLVGIIEKSAQRGASLVKQLLFFGRGVEGTRSVMRLKDSVDELEDIIVQTFPKNITIRAKMSPHAWPVKADPTQIHQVLLNLCVNARDAMKSGGGIAIKLENVTVDENYPGRTADAKPGPYLLLSVTDTGEGISPENIEKIFDPFFTTKEIGKGTGLGLSTVLGIVKSHGGFLTLTSEVGRGATFLVHLPAIPEAEEPGRERSGDPPPRGHDELVLVVDDEEPIRRLAGEILGRHGYLVLAAANGAEGLALFTERADSVKLVLTDCDMPVMSGPEMIKGLRRLDPLVKIIVSTGIQSAMRGEGEVVGLGELDDFVGYLAKPYTPAQLLSAVHDLLASASNGHTDGKL